MLGFPNSRLKPHLYFYFTSVLPFDFMLLYILLLCSISASSGHSFHLYCRSLLVRLFFFNRCLHGLSFYFVLWSVKLSKLQEAVTTPRPQDWAHWFLVFLSQQMHHRFNSYFDKSEASPVQTGLIYLRLQSATWRLWNESEQQTFGSPLIYR